MPPAANHRDPSEPAWPSLLDATLRESGLLREVDGLPVVLGPTIDPLTGRTSAFVRYLEPALGTAAGFGKVLALARALPEAVEVVIRVPAGVAVPGARLRAVYVRVDRALPADAATAAAAAVRVRSSSGAADERFVRELLVTALVDGYADDGRAVDPRHTADHVEHEVCSLGAERRASFVAVDTEGTRLGQATVLIDQDDLTGEEFGELMDLFVLPRYRGRSTSQALTAAATAWTADRRVPLVGHVVCSGDWPDVLRRLVLQGWEADHALWVAPR